MAINCMSLLCALRVACVTGAWCVCYAPNIGMRYDCKAAARWRCAGGVMNLKQQHELLR